MKWTPVLLFSKGQIALRGKVVEGKKDDELVTFFYPKPSTGYNGDTRYSPNRALAIVQWTPKLRWQWLDHLVASGYDEECVSKSRRREKPKLLFCHSLSLLSLFFNLSL